MNLDAYTEASVRLMTELVNSYDYRLEQPERLDSVPTLEAFLRAHRMLGPNRAGQRDLDEIRALRHKMRLVFEAPDETTAIRALNEVLADARVVPKVAIHKDGTRELYFAPPQAPLTRRVACDAGIGLAMMLVDYADRLNVCAAAPCRNVFVDQSRNRSRRYCSETCGSRATVAAHRARQRQAAAT